MEALNKLLKTRGLLDAKFEFDTLLNTKFPKMLVCLGEQLSGPVVTMYDYDESEYVHKVCARLRVFARIYLQYVCRRDFFLVSVIVSVMRGNDYMQFL